MAKQDDWKRITLRIPPELHQKLAEAAVTSSINAEIIDRLMNSFDKVPTSDAARTDLPAKQRLFIQKTVDSVREAMIESFLAIAHEKNG